MEFILELISNALGNFNEFLKSLIDFDNNFFSVYETYISNLPELIKILGALALTLFSVTGLFVFLKKMIKVLIIIAIILVIYLALQ